VSSTAAAVLASWQAPPVLTALLAAAALVYLRGWRKLSRLRSGRFPTWRLAAFLGGLASVWIAAASPLDAFSSLLLTAHMAQHLMLMVVAPPLLLLCIEFARRLLGTSSLSSRAAPHHQPDEDDEQDGWPHDVDQPPQRLVHVLLLPSGTCCASRLYSSQCRA